MEERGGRLAGVYCMCVPVGGYENDSVPNYESCQSCLPEMSYPFGAFSGN